MQYGRTSIRFAFGPHGRTLAVSGGEFGTNEQGAVQLFDTQTGKPNQKFDSVVVFAMPIAFSPNGQLVATQSSTGEVAIWDRTTSTLSKTLKATPSGTALTFSPGRTSRKDSEKRYSFDGTMVPPCGGWCKKAPRFTQPSFGPLARHIFEEMFSAST